MKPKGTAVELDRLGLSSGQASSLPLPVAIEKVGLGGQQYAAASNPVEARLDVSRTTTGYALRLRFEVELVGPCVRCLEEARFPLAIDVREVDLPQTSDEELRSPYVVEGEVDVGRWANDTVVLEMPAQPLCREDCAGLCAVCGESLNDADPEAHRHDTGGDPRMAKLREIKFD
ncbi:MAG TPA: DUF177 domain-containing protein [Solirubrobacterales bacterium]|nr:DUF177 domain-containing protein [Solirubrobacterales bacterium]